MHTFALVIFDETVALVVVPYPSLFDRPDELRPE